MQRTLLIFNAIVLVVIGALVFPMLFEIRDLRAAVENTVDPAVVQEQAEAISAINERADQAELRLETNTATIGERVDQTELRLETTNAAINKMASELNALPELHDEIERLGKQLESQHEELATLKDRAENESPPALANLQEQIDQLKTDLEMRELVRLPIAPDDRLSGKWRMTLPAGYQREVTIQQLSPNRFRLLAGANMSGEYRRQGSKLSITKPDDERLTGFVWEIESPHHMRLVETPPRSKTGSDYTGTTLERHGP